MLHLFLHRLPRKDQQPELANMASLIGWRQEPAYFYFLLSHRATCAGDSQRGNVASLDHYCWNVSAPACPLCVIYLVIYTALPCAQVRR
jgi:hypothetical protein